MPEVKPTHQTPDGSKWINVETPYPLKLDQTLWQNTEGGCCFSQREMYLYGFGHLTPIPQPVVRYTGVFKDGSMTAGWITKSGLLQARPDATHTVTISTIPGEMPVVSVEAVRR